MLGLIALGFSITALVIALGGKAEAEPPEEYIPTQEQIASSGSWAELQVYYDMINEMYLSGVIDSTTYSALYDAYKTRWYQLAEVS